MAKNENDGNFWQPKNAKDSNGTEIDWRSNPYLKQLRDQGGVDFESLVEARIRLKKVQDQIQAEIKGVNSEITVLMATAGLKSIKQDTGEVDKNGKPVSYTLSYVERAGATRLDKKKLLANGVTIEQIEKSTVVGKAPEPTVQVRKSGEKDDEGAD